MEPDLAASYGGLGWAPASRDRRPYTVPMLIGTSGSLASAVTLLST